MSDNKSSSSGSGCGCLVLILLIAFGCLDVCPWWAKVIIVISLLLS